MEQSADSLHVPPIQISAGTTPLKDYRLNVSLIECSLADPFPSVFPRIGYLVCNLFVGGSLDCRLLNYSAEPFYHNRLYVTGLLSESSLLFSMKGEGKGYAFMLHPVIAYHLLKIPLPEVTDRQVVVSDALESGGTDLQNLERNEQFQSLGNRYLERFLLNALPDKSTILTDPIYHAVNHIAAQKGNVEIASLATAFATSKRTFRRQFALKVGLSPQLYARIWKIRNAMELIRKNPKVQLEEIAFLSGYHDVAHLARDFKQRVDIPPSKLNEKMSNPLLQSYMDSKPSH